MYLSVIIPAYNEEQNLLLFLKELEAELAVQYIDGYEIIVCDDHSSDNTFAAINKLKNKNIKSIRLSKRSGSHTAIRAGLSIAKGDAALCLSADGQDDPSILAQMIAKLKEGNHIVWALRKKRSEPFLQKLSAILFYKMLKWFFQTDSTINLANADFFLLDRKVIKAINECKERHTSLFGLLIWLGFKQDCVSYERRDRISGKSKWSFRSKLRMMKDWIISFSGLPLKFISLLGIVIAVIGLLYAIIIFFLALGGHTTPGWAESLIISLLSNGTQLIILGIIGEYLWRTFDETRKRPLFFIEDETDSSKEIK